MRAAPAVDALLDGGGAFRWLIVALHLGAMVALLVWTAQWLLPAQAFTAQTLPGWAWVLAVISALLGGGLGAWQAARLLRRPAGRLCWDGQAWHLRADGQTSALAMVAVQIDLGSHLLLRLHAAAMPRRAQWAIASASAAGQDWHGLRVALHYHAGASARATPPADEARPDR